MKERKKQPIPTGAKSFAFDVLARSLASSTRKRKRRAGKN